MLVQALGAFDVMTLKMKTVGFVEALNEWWHSEDPGVHASADWALRRLEVERPRSVGCDPTERRRWSIDDAGHTLIRVDGPARFEMGSPVSEVARQFDERQHAVRIDRSFEIAACETTVAQFRRFDETYDHNQMFRCPTDDCPVLRVTWHDAARYCNALSAASGIPVFVPR